MIISRTPFRISFFGGGTDYPQWYQENNGAVLSATINKYCFISIRYLPPFFEHKHRIVYSIVEMVKKIDEIKHPSVRAILEFLKANEGVEVHHDGDLPARAGLGSSSSFTVGMLNAVYALKGIIVSKARLAREAIHIERDVLKENVGCQDQVAAAFGGFNKIIFYKNHNFTLQPITLSKERLTQLQNHLMLIFTGLSHFASEIAADQIKNIERRKKELVEMQQLVDYGVDILNGKSDIAKFGKLLHKSWLLKRSLSKRISSSFIDNLYENTLKNGAIGGKLLGAGGGGFMLLFVRPEERKRLKDYLSDFLEVEFSFEHEGSRIIYYDE